MPPRARPRRPARVGVGHLVEDERGPGGVRAHGAHRGRVRHVPSSACERCCTTLAIIARKTSFRTPRDCARPASARGPLGPPDETTEITLGSEQVVDIGGMPSTGDTRVDTGVGGLSRLRVRHAPAPERTRLPASRPGGRVSPASPDHPRVHLRPDAATPSGSPRRAPTPLPQRLLLSRPPRSETRSRPPRPRL